MRFQWHEKKRLNNLDKHDLDFLDAELVFREDHYSYVSDREGEERWVTVGTLFGRIVAVVWTERGDAVRIISFRRARHDERRRYRHLFGRGA